MAEDDDAERDIEQWFLARGLPHFIDDYRASTDIWTRALPALTLLLLGEIAVLAPRRDLSFVQDVSVVAAAFAGLVVVWALVNRARGRPALQRPDNLGMWEVVAFVAVPPIVLLIVGLQVRAAVLTALGNVLLLAAIYVVTSYAFIPTTRWALGRVGKQVGAVVGLLARALPLIALLVTFLFLTQEVWVTAGDIGGITYWIVLALFPLVGILFLLSRLKRELEPLETFATPQEVADDVAGTPAEAFVAATDLADVPPLDRSEWRNIALVWLFSEGVQIFIVSLLVGMFFVVLGVLLVNEATTLSWANHADVLFSFELDNRQLVVTEELLRVAGFLTAFTGLNFTVFLLTDKTYREEFGNEIVDQLRQSLAVRAVYRSSPSLRGGHEASSTISPT